MHAEIEDVPQHAGCGDERAGSGAGYSDRHLVVEAGAEDDAVLGIVEDAKRPFLETKKLGQDCLRAAPVPPNNLYYGHLCAEASRF